MNPIEQELKQKYPDIRFDLIPNEKYKRIYLTGFIVPMLTRNQGIGSKFMEDFINLADQYGYTITLTPDSSYGGNANRLKDFYKRFGFVFNKGNNKDWSHRELMHRLPKTIQEDEEPGTTPDQPTTTKWESGITRGKGNPIDDTSVWQSGITRGKGNPINEDNSGKTLLCVDIQPEYEKGIYFDLNDWAEMVNQHQGRIIFLYNGYNTLGMINEDEYRNWLYELGIYEDIIYGNAIFYDKGYAFFRYCIDEGIDDEEIVNLVKMMVEYDVNDSRDLDSEFWSEYVSRYGEQDIKELMEVSDDCINIPDLMDFLRNLNNIIICGGGENECLKEVEIALQALGKNYQRLDNYIYEKTNELKNMGPINEEKNGDKVALLLINKDDKYLLFKRANSETTNAGKWGLIGGGVEKNESPRTAVKRETKEEAGVELSDYKFLKKYNYRNVEIHLYYATNFNEKNIKLNPEHTTHKWYTLDQLKKLDNLIPTNITFVKDYEQKTNKKLKESLDRIKQIINAL